MITVLLVAAKLIGVHSLDGHEIAISPQQVTSLRAARPHKPNELVAPHVHCLVGLTDGKFVSVTESCAEVREMLENAK
jgi:hypothetical protein